MGLFGEQSTTQHKQGHQTLAQKVCVRLMVNFLYCLFIPLCWVYHYTLYFSSQLFTEMQLDFFFFLANKLPLIECRSAAWTQKNSIQFFSCTMPNPFLNYNSDFLFCHAQMLNSRNSRNTEMAGWHLRYCWGWWVCFSSGFFFPLVSCPSCPLSFCFALFERCQARKGRSTSMWLSDPWFPLIFSSLRSLISHQQRAVSTTLHSRQKWKC